MILLAADGDNDDREPEGLEDIDPEYVRERAEEIDRGDLKDVLNRADEIEDRFSGGGPLGRFLEDFRLLMGLLSDYWKGEYRKMPWWVIASIVFTLLYVLNPVDLIPDFIPVLGQLDDAAVMGACLYLIEQELHEYKQWKKENPQNPSPQGSS